MPGDGTVHGGFELSADAALRTLTSIRDRGAEADASLDSLGRRMDRLATTSETMAGRVDRAWRNMSRSVDRQATEIEMRIDRLEAKVRASNARMRVSLSSNTTSGGGFGGIPGGGGGGYGGMSSAGGRAPTAFSALGGFGGIAAAGLGLSPGIVGLLGGATALAGSAAGGVLGAGSVGLGGLAPLLVGGGLTAAAAKPALANLQNVTKAQQAYNQAIAVYGRNSSQAALAGHRLNVEVAANPAAATASRQIGLFRSAYSSATRGAQAQIYRGISGAAYNVRGALPTLGGYATTASSATANAAINYSGMLTSPQSLMAVGQLTRAFSSDLPIAERTLENMTSTLEHLAVAATPFFHEALLWVDHWSAGISRSTTDTQQVRAHMQNYVNDAKDWARLTGAAYRDIRDIFGAAAPSGNSMVVSLTNTLDRWDAWINNNPQRVQSFFRQAETTTSNIAHAIATLVGDVGQLANYLAPIFNRGMQFISLLSGLGPGGLGIGGSVLYGAYEGARGGRGPSGASLAGAFITGSAGPGMMRSRVAGGTVVGGAAATTALGGTSYLAPRRFGLSTAERGGISANEVYAATMGGAAVRMPARMIRGGAVAGPEAFNSAYGGVEGARYAGPVSELGAAETTLGRFTGVLRGAMAGIARFALPVLGITAALQGAQTPGNVGDKVVGGVNSFLHLGSFGLLPGNTLQRLAGSVSVGPSLASRMPSVRALGDQAGAVRTPEQMRRVQEQVRFSMRYNDLSPGDQAKLDAYLRQVSNTAARNAGVSASNTWETSFSSAISRGERPGRAVATMESGMLTQMHELGPRGARAFAQSTAAWVHQMEMDDPKLRGPLDRLMSGIVGNLNDLSKHTTRTLSDLADKTYYFNGQIFTGVDKTWGAIRDSMVNKAQVAQEKLLGIFGQIQGQAVNSLTQMGFTRAKAQQLVTQMAKGGSAAANAQGTVGGVAGVASAGTAVGAAVSGITKHERGGMIGGRGLLDTVPVKGGMAAPGEAWIANRHTMNALSSATLAKYGKTAWEMIRDETRPHSAPMFATGGFIPDPGTNFTVGQEPQIAGALNRLAHALHKTIYGISGYRSPQHSVAVGGFANDPHTQGIAADIGVNSQMRTSAAQLTAGQLASVGLYRPFDPSGDPNNPEVNHVQLLAGGARGRLRVGGGGGGGQSLRLHGPRSGLGGIPGAMVDQVSRIYARGLQQRLNSHLARTAGGTGISAAGFSGGGTANANRTLGRRMMLAAGWGAGQWPSLDALWTQESGWNANAVNPSSGASGIPQALGHGNVFSLGDAPAQIAWGLNYIRSTYGSPAAAEAHERAFNWYGRGGAVRWAGWNARGGQFTTSGPTLMGVGEHGTETVNITRGAGGGRGGHSILVKMEHVHLGAGDPKTLRKVAETVAGEILEALDRVDGDSSDAHLMGASA